MALCLLSWSFRSRAACTEVDGIGRFSETGRKVEWSNLFLFLCVCSGMQQRLTERFSIGHFYSVVWSLWSDGLVEEGNTYRFKGTKWRRIVSHTLHLSGWHLPFCFALCFCFYWYFSLFPMRYGLIVIVCVRGRVDGGWSPFRTQIP